MDKVIIDMTCQFHNNCHVPIALSWLASHLIVIVESCHAHSLT